MTRADTTGLAHAISGPGRLSGSPKRHAHSLALAPLFFLCRLRGLFLFGASGSGVPLMDAFFSATLSRPPLERVLAWVVRATGTLIGCHGSKYTLDFPRSLSPRGARTCR
jgi:hypothetical protein